MLPGEPGEPRYPSLRSESVPYPLSTSIVLTNSGLGDFRGQTTVRGLTATEDSLDCALLAVAVSVQRCMILE